MMPSDPCYELSETRETFKFEITAINLLGFQHTCQLLLSKVYGRKKTDSFQKCEA